MRLLTALNCDERPYSGIIIILLITAATFGLSLANDFVWDDWTLLVPNQVYRTFDLKGMFLGLSNSFEYLPIRDLTLALDAAIWGMNPFGFHLTNLLLYLCSLIVLHVVVRRMANLFEHTESDRLAFWTTLVFAIHPLHAEVVNFIGARNTILAGLFLFLSISVLIRCLQENRGSLMSLSLFYYVLAAFSKAIVVFFPAFLFCFLWMIPRAVATLRIKMLAFVGFSVTTVAVVLIHLRIGYESGAISERLLGYGSEGQGYVIGKAFHIIWFYLQKLVVPYPLGVDYPLSLQVDGFWMRTLAVAVVVLLLMIAALISRKRSPLLLIGLVWFFASLLPVLNFFPTSPVVADRYAFLGVLGFGLIFADLINQPGALKKLLVGSATVMVVVWCSLSFARTLDWRSDITLWQSARNANPRASRLNLANALWKKGRFEEALQELKVEKELTSSHRHSLFTGKYLLDQGRIDEAIPFFKRSLNEGGDADKILHLYMGQAYEKNEQPRLALKHYLSSIEEINPGILTEEVAQEGLERIWLQYAPQIEALRRSAENSPRDFEKQNEMALFLHSIGQYDKAIAYYQRALKLKPSSWQAWHNVGLVKKHQRKFTEAVQALESALALNPANTGSLNTLGICYGRMGDYDKAEESYLRALQIDPGFVFVNFNLAKLYFVTGDKVKARDYFSRVLSLNGAYRPRVNRYMLMMEAG